MENFKQEYEFYVGELLW